MLNPGKGAHSPIPFPDLSDNITYQTSRVFITPREVPAGLLK